MPLTMVMVLAVGLDFSLLRTRNQVLQSAGYTVIPALSITEAVERFRDGDFDLVILCHSVPTQERGRFTRLIRASGSRTPIVSISERSSQCDAFADATLEDYPSKFLRGIEEVLEKVVKTTATLPPALKAKPSDKHEHMAILEPKLSISNGSYAAGVESL
jgi:CheY-like chemotaxis protein